uniref:Uncharacterized protein n=1 Tax=Panagrolaimus sp. JU765 TaxID=591449 RepID=A0AC34QL33_9BILA
MILATNEYRKEGGKKRKNDGFQKKAMYTKKIELKLVLSFERVEPCKVSDETIRDDENYCRNKLAQSFHRHGVGV